MTKIDIIIAVGDIEKSSKWYQSVFSCKRTHGGSNFAVLEDENGEILICLHKWGEHTHPTMTNPNITSGNGLIIYYKTDKLDIIRKNLEKMSYPIEEEIHVNPNSTKKEFSLRDPDGYFLTVTEYHEYKG